MVTSTHEGSADRPRPAARRPVTEAARRPVTEATRERRRRELHFRRLRHDLIVDAAIGISIALIGLVLAPGLGVIALIAGPLAMIAVGVRARSAFKRRRGAKRPAPRPPRQ